MTLIDAPKSGTGKTFATWIVAYLATGRDAAVMSHATDADEEKKRILASLLAADPVTLIDNVDGPLRSDSLCAVLTAPMYRDRLLGKNENATVPTATLWIANGNNLNVIGDLTRRVILCRLDSKVEQPDTRVFRCDLRAVLAARRAHHVAGRPGMGLPPYGSFEEWSGWVRAALVWLGESDPLANRGAVDAADPERETLRNLLVAWHAEHGEVTLLAGELARRHAEWAKRPDQLDSLAEALDAIPRARADLSARALGRYLLRVRDRVELGLRLRRVGVKNHVATWMVEAVSARPSRGAAGFQGVDGVFFNPSRLECVRNKDKEQETNPATPAIPAQDRERFGL
jgi:putative DNA primase/helicase